MDRKTIVTDENYRFETDPDKYKRCVEFDIKKHEVYGIYLNSTLETHVFDVLEEEYIEMLHDGLLAEEGLGNEFLADEYTVEGLDVLRKKYATGFYDILEKVKKEQEGEGNEG